MIPVKPRRGARAWRTAFREQPEQTRCTRDLPPRPGSDHVASPRLRKAVRQARGPRRGFTGFDPIVASGGICPPGDVRSEGRARELTEFVVERIDSGSATQRAPEPRDKDDLRVRVAAAGLWVAGDLSENERVV